MLFGMPGEVITDEHRAKALLQAKDTLQKLEGLRKELGILPEQLYLVIDTYCGHLQTNVNIDEHAKRKARNKARKEKYEAAMKGVPQGGYLGYAPPVMGHPPLGYDPALPLPYFEDDDDE